MSRHQLYLIVLLVLLSARATQPLRVAHPTDSGSDAASNAASDISSPSAKLDTSVTSPPVLQPADYPLCPFSQRPPARTNVTFSRCLGATEWSCCDDCIDMLAALKAVSANESTVLEFLLPSVLKTASGNAVRQCARFVGFDQCSQELEAMNCAVMCNPDSGNYVVADTEWAGNFSVCDDYASYVYSECKDLPMATGTTFGSLLTNKVTFFKVMFGSLFRAIGGRNITVNVVPGLSSCYNGANKYPPVPACCDPLNDIPGCPFKDNATYGAFVGRRVSPVECKQYISLSPGPSGADDSSTGLALPPSAAPSTSAGSSTSEGSTSGGLSSSVGPSTSAGADNKAAARMLSTSVFSWILAFALLLLLVL
ncbi:hypothetical protein CLOM_g10244 [Closterium sp. NIES-68]|nr:hypothetical protein CLOM_g10244 [Closterium sp. NIES-68]GJP59512.1 hypothetical protein CLOP_g12417 [Closterium sp. NIES-67]GJP87090.1 hypothetical protein CLOP_g17060 [Closterium sp. NIES-67]